MCNLYNYNLFYNPQIIVPFPRLRADLLWLLQQGLCYDLGLFTLSHINHQMTFFEKVTPWLCSMKISSQSRPFSSGLPHYATNHHSHCRHHCHHQYHPNCKTSCMINGVHHHIIVIIIISLSSSYYCHRKEHFQSWSWAQCREATWGLDIH